MTGDDELRARLSRIDPMRPSGPADPLPSPAASEIQERVMQTIDHDAPEASTQGDAAQWRRPRTLVAAAVAVLALGAGAILATSTDDPPSRAAKTSTLALSLPDGAVSSSCAQFDVAVLREMPVAFSGTVTALGGDAVTLDVDRWYKGGTAEVVTIGLPSEQSSAALDGVDFAEGERFLLTATDGTVNGCGFSGPASPQLERAFDDAFTG